MRPQKAKKPAAKPAAAPAVARSARILVVDDDEAMLRLVGLRLIGAGYEVKPTTSAAEALEICEEFKPDLIISDLYMTPIDGLGLLKEVQKRWPSLCVIIQSGHGSIPVAVQATQNGAFGFLVKPVEKAELLEQVDRALKVSSFGESQGVWRAGIVSRSRLMEERIAQANLAARSDDPVLLMGEAGTGKELFARAIHEAGNRRDRPFEVINCSALAARVEALPHDAAAAREATAVPAAKRTPAAAKAAPPEEFDLRGGGTLLLEDVEALTPELQVRLLAAIRAVEADSLSDHPRVAPARLISSSSHDLEKLVDRGDFRGDLYDRLSVVPIEVPPLGRRREDIPLLIGHFLTQSTGPDGQEKRYAPKAIELLSSRNWPGNVDQLRSVVKKSIALSPNKLMTVEFVKKCLDDEPTQELPSFDEAREEFSRNYLMQNLRITEGNVSQAARLAKRNRTDFYKLMSRHNLNPDNFKKPGTK